MKKNPFFSLRVVLKSISLLVVLFAFSLSAHAAETTVQTSAELTSALSGAQSGDVIKVNGVLGSATDYTLYEVTASNVTVKGLSGNKVYGTFNLKGDADTLDGLNVYSRGGGSDSLKNAVNVVSNAATIKNNRFEMPNPATVAANGGVGNGVVVWPYGSAASNLTISGNQFIGFGAVVPNWSSSGLLIAENLDLARVGLGGQSSKSISVDDRSFALNNTFTGNNNDYVHSNWAVMLNGGSESLYSSVSNTNALLDAVASSPDGATVIFGSDITTTSQLTLTQALTIDGNGHTLHANFNKTDNSNNSAIGVQHSNVIIKNLVLDGALGGQVWNVQLHGVNVFQSTNVTLNDVTLSNFGGSGLNVNASTVTVNNLTTSNNKWNGVDVDKGTSLMPATLTVNGTSHHSENTASNPAIWVDNNASTNNSVVDTNNQYISGTFTKDGLEGRYYNLKPIVVTPPSSDNQSHSDNHSQSQNQSQSGGHHRSENGNGNNSQNGQTRPAGRVLGASDVSASIQDQMGAIKAQLIPLMQQLIIQLQAELKAQRGY